MKSYPAPPIPEATVTAMQRLVDSGISQTEIISAMRAAGLSMIPSIKLLASFYGLSVTEAKIAVHLSQAWADCRESNDAIHESALAAAKETGFEEAYSGVPEQVAR